MSSVIKHRAFKADGSSYEHRVSSVERHPLDDHHHQSAELSASDSTASRVTTRSLSSCEPRRALSSDSSAWGTVQKRYKQRGFRIVMLTGDSETTASAVAAVLGVDKVIAGVRLVKGDLRGLVRARRLSRATMRNIRQNQFIAFVYNALGFPVAAGFFHPASGILLSPVIAATALSFSSDSVALNTLRLNRSRL